MDKEILFDVYRYQIVPRAKAFQLHLLERVDFEDAIKRKNLYFDEALLGISGFTFPFESSVDMSIDRQRGIAFLRLGKKSNVKRYTKDKFIEEEYDSWPPINIVCDLNSDRQILLVERRTSIFRNTGILVNHVLKNINKRLARYQLVAQAMPLFRRDDFWESVEQYSGRVRWVAFALMTPNMSSISSTLAPQLKALAQNTLSNKTEVKISTDKDAYLNLSRENADLRGLVDYSAQGAGEAVVKVNGLRAQIKTSNYPLTIEIESLIVSVKDIQSVLKILEDFYNGIAGKV